MMNRCEKYLNLMIKYKQMEFNLATKRMRDKEADNKTPTFYFTYTRNCKHKKM